MTTSSQQTTATKELMDQAQKCQAVFFDADGTLLSFKTHQVLPSTLEAIEALHEKGILCILATGRPLYGFDENLDLDLFDAYVTFNGSLCIDHQGTALIDNPMDPDDVAACVSQVEQGLYPCLFMENNRFYVSDRAEQVVQLEQLLHASFDDDPVQRALDHPVYQLNAFLEPGQEHLLMDGLNHAKYYRWHDSFIDVVPGDAGKGAGVVRLLDALGIPASQAMAFGDGGNDVDMFQAVGVPVAMGNASDAVKAQAAYVTASCDDNGIYKALKALGVIS